MLKHFWSLPHYLCHHFHWHWDLQFEDHLWLLLQSHIQVVLQFCHICLQTISNIYFWPNLTSKTLNQHLFCHPPQPPPLWSPWHSDHFFCITQDNSHRANPSHSLETLFYISSPKSSSPRWNSSCSSPCWQRPIKPFLIVCPNFIVLPT